MEDRCRWEGVSRARVGLQLTDYKIERIGLSFFYCLISVVYIYKH